MFPYADRKAVFVSWASHNPEKCDELTREGIENYLGRTLGKVGFTVIEDWAEPYGILIEAIQTTPELRGLYIELQRLASVDIMKAEQDYFGGLGR